MLRHIFFRSPSGFRLPGKNQGDNNYHDSDRKPFSNHSTSPSGTQSDYQIMSDDHSYNAAERAQTESRPWTFNVTLDPTFEQLLDSDSLKSAVLTLTLKPELESTNSDTVIIQDLSDIDAPEHRSLLAQATTTIEVELLNVYSGKDLLEVFKNHAGKLPISYHHPEKISSIQLRLTTEVPDKKKLFIGGGIAFILCYGRRGRICKLAKKKNTSCPALPSSR